MMIYDASNVLVDADSTPTVAVRRNGSATADVVTVTKRAATTGIYDCSVTFIADAVGDIFELEEQATVSAVVYDQTFSVTILTSDSNVVAIGSDLTAAGNLRDQYNGTGYFNDAAPAYQAQVSDIAITGSAINTTYENWTITTGTVAAGTPDDTIARDGNYYQIAPVGGVIDMEIEFQIGSDGVPTQNVLFGRLGGIGGTIDVQAYNYELATFQTLDTIPGTLVPLDLTNITPLFAANVGSGADAGQVRIRLVGTGLGGANIFINQFYTSFSVVNRSVGYADGSIWIDTASGNTGTVPFIDGVADKPVGSWADALAVSTQVNLRRFNARSGDLIVLTSNMGGTVLEGENFGLDLGGFVPPSLVQRGIVFGAEGGTAESYFYQCNIGDEAVGMTATGNSVFKECGITSVLLSTSADGEFTFADCFQAKVNNVSPFAQIDFGAAPTINRTVLMTNWQGTLYIDNMRTGDEIEIHGNGIVLIGAGCTGGSVATNGSVLTSVLGTLDSLTVSVTQQIDEMTQLDGSLHQFTINALENAPSSSITPGEVWDYADANGTGTKTEQLASVQVVTDQLSDTLQLNGEGALYQFTVDALENAPGGGGPGDVVTVDAFTQNALNQLAAIKVYLTNPYNSTTRQLTLVQNCEYSDDSLIGPVQFEITQAGVVAGDAVRLKAYGDGTDQLVQDGTVVDIAGTLYAQIALTAEQTGGLEEGPDWEFNLLHVAAGGEESPLLAAQQMEVIQSPQ